MKKKKKKSHKGITKLINQSITKMQGGGPTDPYGQREDYYDQLDRGLIQHPLYGGDKGTDFGASLQAILDDFKYLKDQHSPGVQNRELDVTRGFFGFQQGGTVRDAIEGSKPTLYVLGYEPKRKMRRKDVEENIAADERTLENPNLTRRERRNVEDSLVESRRVLGEIGGAETGNVTDSTFQKEFTREGGGKDVLARDYNPKYITVKEGQIEDVMKEIPKGSNIMFMDHSGSKFFGQNKEDFVDLLVEKAPNTCIGGTCFGANELEDLKDRLPLSQVILDNDEWQGFNANKKGLDAIIFDEKAGKGVDPGPTRRERLGIRIDELEAEREVRGSDVLKIDQLLQSYREELNQPPRAQQGGVVGNIPLEFLAKSAGVDIDNLNRFAAATREHESFGDYEIIEKGGGPGRGAYQFDADSLKTAAIKAKRIYKAAGQKAPAVYSQIANGKITEAHKLPSEIQDELFFSSLTRVDAVKNKDGTIKRYKVSPSPELKKYDFTNDDQLAEAWQKLHNKGEEDRREDFKKSLTRIPKLKEGGKKWKKQQGGTITNIIKQAFDSAPINKNGLYEETGPVVVPSNNITMKGIKQRVLGISDTGEKRIMNPGENHVFNNASRVLEIPMFQEGGMIAPSAQTAVPVQTETYKGVPEQIIWPDASITDVHARKSHKEMMKDDEGDKYTDFIDEESYVVPAIDKYKITLEEAEEIILGIDISPYYENKRGKEPEATTLADLLFRGKYKSATEITAAEAVKQIKKLYKTVDNPDVFEEATNQDNKGSRINPLAAIVSLIEEKRDVQPSSGIQGIVSAGSIAREGGRVRKLPGGTPLDFVKPITDVIGIVVDIFENKANKKRQEKLLRENKAAISKAFGIAEQDLTVSGLINAATPLLTENPFEAGKYRDLDTSQLQQNLSDIQATGQNQIETIRDRVTNVPVRDLALTGNASAIPGALAANASAVSNAALSAGQNVQNTTFGIRDRLQEIINANIQGRQAFDVQGDQFGNQQLLSSASGASGLFRDRADLTLSELNSNINANLGLASNAGIKTGVGQGIINIGTAVDSAINPCPCVPKDPTGETTRFSAKCGCWVYS